MKDVKTYSLLAVKLIAKFGTGAIAYNFIKGTCKDCNKVTKFTAAFAGMLAVSFVNKNVMDKTIDNILKK